MPYCHKTVHNMDNAVNNKRIAKNTLVLYVRTLFIMLVSLFTSRVVLNTLGVEDYGIYNVVGGVVAMFGFINASMSAATQRYITFALGKGDIANLQKVFSTTLQIHILIAAIIFVLGETVGVWFMYTQMQIPADRMNAAFWVLQCSIASTVVMILSVPYNAEIVAHEKMSAFAYISLLEAILKLLIVYLLKVSSFDKLIFYAILIFVVQLIIRLLYGNYCKRHFRESKFHWIWNKKLFHEMICFASWNLWGNCASVAFTQGINILLNIFFGPAINAARGLAVQVQAAVSQFSTNFQTAINPQITKSYAAQDYGYMHSLIFRSSKFTFYLLLFFSLPIMLETDNILRLWLGTVPDFTAIFIRLMLCITIIDSMANPLGVSASATGKIKLYQGILGGILLGILPIAYIVLKLGGDPVSVFVVHLGIAIIAFIVRLFIIRNLIRLSLSDYNRTVIIPCLLVSISALILPIFLKNTLHEGILSFLTICIVSMLCVSMVSYRLGLSKSEQKFLRDKLKNFFSNIRR